MWEDVLVNLQAYYYANIISHIEEPFYHYDITREGRMVAKRYHESIIQQQVSCINHLESFFQTVGYNANDFLLFRKCMLKSKFLQLKKVDYTKFKECFPEVVQNPYIKRPFEKYAWEKAAIGNSIPYRIWNAYIFLSNAVGYLVRKLQRESSRYTFFSSYRCKLCSKK